MIEWQFEHFKTFTPYEIMQQAAAALSLYEGENTDGANPKMGKLTDELTINTGHPAWMPDRDNGNLRVNTEGSVFRNKARLFSAFYICVPPDLLKNEGYGKQVMLTDFGHSLARGEISESEFYEYIVKKFQYPHLAYSDYEEWVNSGSTIRPLLLIIKSLVKIFENAGRNAAYITSFEVYKYLQPLTDENCDKAVEEILDARVKGISDSVTGDTIRIINEMLAFLAIAGYVYIDSTEPGADRYWLNLIMKHPKEKTLFYLCRSAGGAGTGTKKTSVNVLDIYKSMWEE